MSTVPASPLRNRLAGVIGCRSSDIPVALWGAGYFFCLLAGYYVLRPLRDEMGIRGGVDQLQWLFTATFLVMLAAVPAFGWLSSRVARRRLVPAVYGFFIVNLVVFFFLFHGAGDSPWPARAFFVWTSVYNLFIVSVFWSLMADLCTRGEAARIFGFVAAGGSAGASTGPALTAWLAGVLGPVNLLPLSAGFLGLALLCVSRLLAWRGERVSRRGLDRSLGGGIFEAVPLILRSRYLMGLVVFMLLTTSVATVLYFQQARIVADAFADSAARTRVFAGMDLAVNVLAVTTQLFLTGRFVRRLGLGAALALVPALMVAGFLALWALPVLAVLVLVQVGRRAAHYAVLRPAREMLFTVVSPREKYKAKNFIDTVVYRGGDAVSGWFYAGLAGAGMGPGAVALVAVPLAGAWLWSGLRLGRAQARIAEHHKEVVDHEPGSSSAP
ncbi:MAG: MFS transporter [Gammaproteobacteria bacterium]